MADDSVPVELEHTAQREWATLTCAIPADPGELWQTHVLQRLDEVDLLPSADVDEAVCFLAGRTANATWFYSSQHEELLRDLSAFCHEFFSLGHAERRNQWEALFERSHGCSAARLHLTRIKRGLKIVPAFNNDTDDRVREWGRLMCTLLLAPPQIRALIRRDALSKMAEDPKVWLQASRLLARRHRRVAKLDTVSFKQCRHFLKRVHRSRGLIADTWQGRSRMKVVFAILGLVIVLALAFLIAWSGLRQPYRERKPQTSGGTTREQASGTVAARNVDGNHAGRFWPVTDQEPRGVRARTPQDVARVRADDRGSPLNCRLDAHGECLMLDRTTREVHRSLRRRPWSMRKPGIFT